MSSRKIKRPEDADTEGRGRSFKRRAAKIYDELALEVVGLPEYRISAMPVDADTKAAVRTVQSTSAHVARRRHLRHVAGLLRSLSEDEERALRRFMDGKSYTLPQANEGPDLEALRDRLVDAEQYTNAIDETCELLPDVDIVLVQKLAKGLHETEDAKNLQRLYRELRRAHEVPLHSDESE